ncbi:hypothetical protein JOM49_002912 [Amycolatopsis magusensis]|uniref:Uncharacterized protein n=1 Tax=Amycolatopsis magusensis TaxID=882444 RepID=A0ABS4PPP2_9PSEU|nr:hypothetical protein [Amycolatopsis magusensis]
MTGRFGRLRRESGAVRVTAEVVELAQVPLSETGTPGVLERRTSGPVACPPATRRVAGVHRSAPHG